MGNKTITGRITNPERQGIFSFYAECSFEQSVSENASYVTVATYFATTNTNYKFDTVGERAASITVNGQKYSVSKRIYCNPWTSDQYMIQKVSRVKVEHNEDGTATMTISAKADGTAARYGPSLLSSDPCTIPEQTVTLDKINRGIILVSAPDFNDTDNPTVTYQNPIGTGVTSAQACISFDGTTDNISYRSIDKDKTSYTFVLTDAERAVLRNGITNAKSGNVNFIIKTVANGNTVTSSLMRRLTITEENARPTVSVSLTPQNGQAAGTVFVQTLSAVKVVITATPKFGASVVKYETVIDGKTYDTQSFVSDVFATSGAKTVKVTITDSRGYSASVSLDIDVLPYSLPAVVSGSGAGSVLCFRGNSDGQETSDSTTVYIKAKMQYSQISSGGTVTNTCKLRWRSRKVSATGFGVWTELTTDSLGEYAGLIAGSFAVTDSYEIEIGVLDTMGGASSVVYTIPEGTVTFHLKKGGKAVGVGKYADEDNTVAVAWKTVFDSGFLGTALLTQAADVLSFAEACAVGVTPFLTTNTTTNIPTQGYYDHSPGVVFRCGSTWGVVYLFDYIDGSVAVCNMVQNTWSQWRYIKSALPTT